MVYFLNHVRRPFLLVIFASFISYHVAAQKVEENKDNNCICKLLPRPLFVFKEKRARWMMHSLDWASLSTISTRLEISIEETEDGELEHMEHVDESDNVNHALKAAPNSKTSKKILPVPFGNVYSFVDGKCGESTGTPYFYGTSWDQSFKDILKNRAVSLTLSENAIPTVCSSAPIDSCVIGSMKMGDPESPLCSRLVVSGFFETVDPKKSPKEHQMAEEALFQRHPTMAKWPKDHGWVIAKIVIKDLWFIDMFGGATIMDVDEYYGVSLSSDEGTEVI